MTTQRDTVKLYQTPQKTGDRFYQKQHPTKHEVEIYNASGPEYADIVYRSGFMTHPYKVTATGKNYSHIDAAITALQQHRRVAANSLAATADQTESDKPAPTGDDCSPYIRELVNELDRLFNINKQHNQT